MNRLFTKIADGSAPNGRWYAGDINAIQDAVAAITDLAQNFSAATVAIGESGLQILRYAAGEMRITGKLRTDGILRALGGLYVGSFTSAQIAALPTGTGAYPYGVEILNSDTSQRMMNFGTDSALDFRPMSGSTLVTSSGSFPGNPIIGQQVVLRLGSSPYEFLPMIYDGAKWCSIEKHQHMGVVATSGGSGGAGSYPLGYGAPPNYQAAVPSYFYDALAAKTALGLTPQYRARGTIAHGNVNGVVYTLRMNADHGDPGNNQAWTSYLAASVFATTGALANNQPYIADSGWVSIANPGSPKVLLRLSIDIAFASNTDFSANMGVDVRWIK